MRLIINREGTRFDAALRLNAEEAEELREYLKESDSPKEIVFDKEIELTSQQMDSVKALMAIDTAMDADGGQSFLELLEHLVLAGFEARDSIGK